jgi:hypothetical protein
LIIKGVPSLINDLRTLYKDNGKVIIMGELLKDMSNLMEKQMCLVPDDQDE